jgi:hypothetical protein
MEKKGKEKKKGREGSEGEGGMGNGTKKGSKDGIVA